LSHSRHVLLRNVTRTTEAAIEQSTSKRLRPEKKAAQTEHEKNGRSVPLVDSSGERAPMLSQADRGPN